MHPTEWSCGGVGSRKLFGARKGDEVNSTYFTRRPALPKRSRFPQPRCDNDSVMCAFEGAGPPSIQRVGRPTHHHPTVNRYTSGTSFTSANDLGQCDATPFLCLLIIRDRDPSSSDGYGKRLPKHQGMDIQQHRLSA